MATDGAVDSWRLAILDAVGRLNPLRRKVRDGGRVLLGRRQLATDFEWRLFVGLSYSFGSIYNNVVNSRFAGSSGGFTRAF